MSEDSAAAGHLHTAREVEVLLNPAYCSLVLSLFANTYSGQNKQNLVGVPYPLVFLCLPMTLHAETRSEINSHRRAFGLHRLVREHPHLLVGLTERTKGFKRITRQAMIFGHNHGCLEFQVGAGLVMGKKTAVQEADLKMLGEEPTSALMAARMLAHYFSELTMAEVFIHLGLRP